MPVGGHADEPSRAGCRCRLQAPNSNQNVCICMLTSTDADADADAYETMFVCVRCNRCLSAPGSCSMRIWHICIRTYIYSVCVYIGIYVSEQARPDIGALAMCHRHPTPVHTYIYTM